MIAHWGYSVEAHEIITGDGYILNMLRIAHGQILSGERWCLLLWQLILENFSRLQKIRHVTVRRF